jgi:hypothetical protein
MRARAPPGKTLESGERAPSGSPPARRRIPTGSRPANTPLRSMVVELGRRALRRQSNTAQLWRSQRQSPCKSALFARARFRSRDANQPFCRYNCAQPAILSVQLRVSPLVRGRWLFHPAAPHPLPAASVWLGSVPSTWPPCAGNSEEPPRRMALRSDAVASPGYCSSSRSRARPPSKNPRVDIGTAYGSGGNGQLRDAPSNAIFFAAPLGIRHRFATTTYAFSSWPACVSW